MRVIDLTPGDLIRNGSMKAIFIAQTVHPIWPSLQLVIWWLPNQGRWSHDALRPVQYVGTLEPGAPEDNQQRLREALLGDRKVSA